VLKASDILFWHHIQTHKKKRKVKEKITNHKPSHLTTDIVDSLAVIKVDWNQNTRRNPNENEKVEK